MSPETGDGCFRQTDRAGMSILDKSSEGTNRLTTQNVTIYPDGKE